MERCVHGKSARYCSYCYELDRKEKPVSIIDEAYARRAAAPPPKYIDYNRMNTVLPRQRAALTRAMRLWREAGGGSWYDPNRDDARVVEAAEGVAKVCKDAIIVWDEIGAWPDSWHTFNIALRDVAGLDLDDIR